MGSGLAENLENQETPKGSAMHSYECLTRTHYLLTRQPVSFSLVSIILIIQSYANHLSSMFHYEDV